jgi:hypothetical protein
MVLKPWMEEREVDIIEEILSKLQPRNSLEWGAGYSTIYFTKFLQKDAKWTSIEHNKDWAHKISCYLLQAPIFQCRRRQYEFVEFYLRGQLSAVGLKTCNKLVRLMTTCRNPKPLIKVFHVPPNHMPWSDINGDGTYSDLKDYIEFPGENESFDFILIDGRARKDCLIKTHEIVRDKGIVILHDANRKYYQEPFKLYKHQILYCDNRKDAGGLWIGSKGLEISDVLNLGKHRKIWCE